MSESLAIAPQRRPALTRPEIEAVLHALDPVELRAPSVRRVAAKAFVTEPVLARMARRLDRSLREPDSVVLQFGCRSAGVGMWLAEHRQLQLVQIDPSQYAVEQAMHACGRFQLETFPTFVRTELHDTRMTAGSVQAALSVAALYESEDPMAVLAEAHRVLAIGSMLQFDVFVPDDDPDAREWVRGLQYVGFDVLDIDDQTTAWRAIARDLHQSRLQFAPYLVDRLGTRQAAAIITRSRDILEQLDRTRRVELVAQRRRTRQPRGSTGHLKTRVGLIDPTYAYAPGLCGKGA